MPALIVSLFLFADDPAWDMERFPQSSEQLEVWISICRNEREQLRLLYGYSPTAHHDCLRAIPEIEWRERIYDNVLLCRNEGCGMEYRMQWREDLRQLLGEDAYQRGLLPGLLVMGER